MDWMKFFAGDRHTVNVPASQVPDLIAFGMQELVALSASRNGYRREAAVTEMLRRQDGAAIKSLLPRASDYVPKIAANARAGMPVFFDEQFVPHWFAARDEVIALDRVRRVDLTPLRQSIEAFLLPHAGHLVSMTPASDFRFARWAFSLRLRGCSSASEIEALARQAVASADPVVADRAMTAIEQLGDSGLTRRMVVIALQSASPKVRANAVRLLVGTDAYAHRQHLLRAACFDRGSVVRALAFANLDDSDRAAVVEQARHMFDGALTRAGPRAASLHVLLLAKVADVPELAWDMVGSASPSVRAAAWSCRWQALGRADAEELKRALVDPSAAVRRVALKQIKAGEPGPEPEWLRAVGVNRPHAFGTVISCLRHASPWERLQFLLDVLATSTATDTRQMIAVAELRRWNADMARCYVAPTSSQAQAIQASWLAAPRNRSLSARLDSDVVAHLQAFGIV